MKLDLQKDGREEETEKMFEEIMAKNFCQN